MCITPLSRVQDPLFFSYKSGAAPAHPAVWMMPVVSNGLARGITGAVEVRNEPPDLQLGPFIVPSPRRCRSSSVARQISSVPGPIGPFLPPTMKLM